MDSLLQRLKQRKFVQWAIAYLAAAFVLFQVMDALAEPLSLSSGAQRGILTLVVVGFFVTLVLAWYHGEKGHQRVSMPEFVMITLLVVLAGAGISVVGGVEEVAETTGDAAQPTELERFVALPDGRPTIAVLPLDNLSAKEENGYLAAGIHEELLRLLSLVRELGVISRTSVLKYAGGTTSIPRIAAELGARYLVEGSVQEDEGRVRIQIQLIDALSDRHLWARRFDRTLEDIFELQTEVAQAIAGALEAIVTPEEQSRIEAPPTQDRIAYQLYLQAAKLNPFVREEFDVGVELLRRATRLDPDFALAHAGLAFFMHEGSLVHRAMPYDSAVARAELAVALDPDLPSAHASKALVLHTIGQNDAARTSARQALALDGSSESAWIVLTVIGWNSGDPVSGALAGREAIRVSPHHPAANEELGFSLLFAGMYDEAAQWFARAVDLRPGSIYAHFGLISASAFMGDTASTRAYKVRWRAWIGDNPFVLYYSAWSEILAGDLAAADASLSELVSSQPDFAHSSVTARAMSGWVAVQLGQPGARERLEDLRRLRIDRLESPSHTLLNDLTLIASALGGEDEQLRWFLEARELNRGDRLYLFRSVPWFDRIRDRPEFQSWLQGMEQRMAMQQSELAAMGDWMPEAVLGGGVSGRR